MPIPLAFLLPHADRMDQSFTPLTGGTVGSNFPPLIRTADAPITQSPLLKAQDRRVASKAKGQQQLKIRATVLGPYAAVPHKGTVSKSEHLMMESSRWAKLNVTPLTPCKFRGQRNFREFRLLYVIIHVIISPWLALDLP
jgi:hypothetical protein